MPHQWPYFLKELARVASDPVAAEALCERYVHDGSSTLLRVLAFTGEAIYSEILAYRSDYEAVEKCFDADWESEHQRVRLRVLDPFGANLNAITLAATNNEDAAARAFDELIRMWRSFDKDSVSAILARSKFAQSI